METVADYGTVLHFGVQTLTTGVFSTWLNGGNAGGAAQIAGVILVLILILVGLERAGRGNGAVPPAGPRLAPDRAGSDCRPRALAGDGAVPDAVRRRASCCPSAVMLAHSAAAPEGWLAPGLVEALAEHAGRRRGLRRWPRWGRRSFWSMRCGMTGSRAGALAAAADADRLCRTRGGAGAGASCSRWRRWTTGWPMRSWR